MRYELEPGYKERFDSLTGSRVVVVPGEGNNRDIGSCILEHGGVCCGAYHVAPEGMTAMLTEHCCAHCPSLKHVREALSLLQSIQNFAYENGFRECGYDPVHVLADVLGLPRPK